VKKGALDPLAMASGVQTGNNNMTRLRTRREGFTLIEMLVVIGIIAVLAAIILPVYMAAQEKARQGNCLSNMHAIANAIKIAYQDEKSYPVEPYVDGQGYWQGGVSALYPDYLTAAKSLACPDDQSVTYSDTNPGSHNPAAWKYSSYNYFDANNDGTWDALTFNRWGLGEADDPDGDGMGNAGTVNVPEGLPSGVSGGWNQGLTAAWAQYATIRTKAKWPGLANNTAPDNTIICVCRHHEGFGNGVKRPEIVVRVGGNAGAVRLGDADFIGQLDL
jgi:prepilin-type N-terminal cleavage/methylation domain-containing protein